MFNDLSKQIIKKIEEYNNIVIARHIGPDPDAIASEIALRDIIKLNYENKNVKAIGVGVAKFKYLGTLDKLTDEERSNTLLIMLDLPEASRLDGTKKDDYVYTIKIDHHPCDHPECDIDYIDDEASSTCQILCDIIFNNNLIISRECAEVLFTGIVSDSDRFLLSYTSPRTFDIASKLLDDYNIDLSKIYNNLYSRPLSERKFEAFITNNLTVTENGFGYIKLTNEDYKKYEVDANTASNMVNDFNFINELRCWAFSSYDEKNKVYRINIRSKDVIINDVAQNFNGGGHKLASGARLETMEEVDELFKALDERCKEYKKGDN
ncbi:MAG: bifunctional oligoribonuclease/PAP phosphatase NrnA [Bacilli bacterium]|nr:bifunctional oligoribonuclease/PAP phosphatase NrnA [Bacilli bacterium]